MVAPSPTGHQTWRRAGCCARGNGEMPRRVGRSRRWVSARVRGVVTGCISNPTAGAMGYHYFNWAKMDDPSIDESDPEVLVYHRADDGTLVLGAVEWVVPKTLWEQAGHTEAPVVFEQTLHVLNPVLNWYIAHAWIWKHNPAGMFADWNPDVSCP